MNDLSGKTKAELEAGLKEYHLAQTQAAALPPLVFPAAVNDLNVPVELRDRIAAQYCAALTERPSATYTAADRTLLAQQIRKVLLGMGY
jgi:hypothetical protein